MMLRGVFQVRGKGGKICKARVTHMILSTFFPARYFKDGFPGPSFADDRNKSTQAQWEPGEFPCLYRATRILE